MDRTCPFSPPAASPLPDAPPKRHAGFPPGPRSWLPIRVFRDLRRDPLDFLTRLTRDHGDISSFSALGQRYVVINHPDLAREVLLTQADAFWKGPALQNSKGVLGEGLLTAEGQTHRQHRRMMQPALHAKAVERYAGEVIAGTAELIARWKNTIGQAGNGGRGGGGRGEKSCDIRPDMMGLTLVIAGRALFGAILEGDIQTVHRCMDDLMNNYVRTVLPWGWVLNLLPLASTRKLARAQRDLFAIVDRIIQQRRAGAERGRGDTETRGRGDGERGEDGPSAGWAKGGSGAKPDLLSMMIAATDSEEGAAAKLSDQQLRDHAVTILTAGHETTANAMTFTLFLLAKYPAEQQKLRDEIRGVLGNSPPESLTPEMIEALPRTRWVLSESMRLYPPAWTLGRQNQRPVELAGYRLPSKCTLLIPQWTLHRDPRFWDRPLEFVPERWREPAHLRFAYLPFSTGPRNCIGESFAWLEMMLVLPLLLRAFEFTLPPGTPDPALTPAITLRPRDAVSLSIRTF